MTDVFIAIAPDDRDTCAQYVQALAARGVRAWFESETLDDSDQLSVETKHRLELASALLFFLTPNANRLRRIPLETTAYAHLLRTGKAGKILPVRISPVEISRWLTAFIPVDAVVDAVGLSADETADAITAAL